MSTYVVVLMAAMAPGPAATDPRQVVSEMQRLYADCTSYRDEGEVEVAYLAEDGTARDGDRRPFSTLFVRPGRFRFEFKDESGHYGNGYVIWADGKAVRSWWTLRPQVQSWESIGDAVDAATGVSGGAAHVVPALLLSDVGGAGPHTLQELKLTGEEVVGGVTCWRLEGRGWMAFMSSAPMTFWVEKSTPHLRRIQYFFDIPGSRSRTTITYRPATNGPIEPKAFAFSPPAGN